MEPDDEHAVRLRARMIGLGVWLTYALCATMGPGVALLADGPERTAISVLLVVAVLATFALSRLPADAIARHPRAEAFFLGWSSPSSPRSRRSPRWTAA